MNFEDFAIRMKESLEKREKEVFKAFDEEGNLLYHDVGSIGGGLYWGNCLFYCSKCLKEYFSRGHMKRHAIRCIGYFPDGIHKIDKYSQKKETDFMNLFSRMSRITQGIDISMSNETALRAANKIVLVLVENKKPVGYITFCRRKFSSGEKISLEDFFVMEYKRRKGYGNFLFDAMLKEIGYMGNDKEKIEKNIIVNKPSKELRSFIIKRDYLKIGIW